MSFRIGQGFDVHPLMQTPGRPLILGGIEIPGGPGLKGHSDADALAHALADAVLGASGRGDLGRHFPDDDPRWAGANSLEILDSVVRMAQADGWVPVNADCTVIAERPRLAPYVDEMAARLAQVLGGPVLVKATRPEGAFATEAIGAMAVVLLQAHGEGDGG